MSTTRVPVSEPLSTIRPAPSARCSSLSDALPASPFGEPEGLNSRLRSDGPFSESESRQALRAVVGNLHAGDLVERPVRLSGVTHQFRRIAVDLVKIRAVRRDPVVGRAAGDVSTAPPGVAISRNLRARASLPDTQPTSVAEECAEVPG